MKSLGLRLLKFTSGLDVTFAAEISGSIFPVHNVCILDRLEVRAGHDVKHQELNAVSLLVRADVPVENFLRVTAVRVLCKDIGNSIVGGKKIDYIYNITGNKGIVKLKAVRLCPNGFIFSCLSDGQSQH